MGGGLIVGGSAETGIGDRIGAGVTGSAGVGVFGGGSQGLNGGGFGSIGGFALWLGHIWWYPEYPEGNNDTFAAGAFAGRGDGLFLTKACSASHLGGPFNTNTINLDL